MRQELVQHKAGINKSNSNASQGSVEVDESQRRLPPVQRLNKSNNIEQSSEEGIESGGQQLIPYIQMKRSVNSLKAIPSAIGKKTGKGIAQIKGPDNANLAQPVQLRGENPYNVEDSHNGWELTAHHVIPHSDLKNSLEILKKYDKHNQTNHSSDVLKAAIPDTIDQSMLDNMKVKLSSFPEGETLVSLRSRLAGTKSNDDLNKDQLKKIGEMRDSFFEWQGGNQFLGPNTSIRAEPTKSGDDIDYDGREFSPLGGQNFDSLTTKGEELNPYVKKHGDTKKIEKKLQGKDVLQTDAEFIKAKLLEILAITKDVQPNDFDPDAWTEITDLNELRKLGRSKKFNRKHMEDYAFFKVPIATADDIGLEYKYGSYSYDGRALNKKEKPTLKGDSHYVNTKKAVSIKGESNRSLYHACQEANIPTSTYLPNSVAEKGRAIINLEDQISSASTTIKSKESKVSRLTDTLHKQKNMRPEKRKKYQQDIINANIEISTQKSNRTRYLSQLADL